MLGFLGGLVGAGANLLGGLYGQNNQANINQQNIAAQEQINQQNINEQLNFAQHGIQWKVADAQAAGINPLAALGANTASFSNVVAPQAGSSNSFGTGVANAGQDLGRAIQATRSPEEQAVAVQKTALDLESLQLDNELKKASLASSIAKVNQAGVPPGIVGDRRPGMQALPGAQTDYTVQRSPDGSLVSIPSGEFQRGAFGNSTLMAEWNMRNRIGQYFGFNVPPELAAPAPGNQWFVNPLTGKWYQSRSWSNTFGHPIDTIESWFR